jgi:hypothetical protein
VTASPTSGPRTRSATSPSPGSGAPRAISRFIVMAILQAARAERLGLPEKSAYSWGLNRAIFYAAAKQGFRHGGAGGGEGGGAQGTEKPKAASAPEEYRLGQDLAYRDPTSSTLYFTIGGDTQTEKEFQHQIIARFGDAKNFERAWKEAVDIVADADEETLATGNRFFEHVYRPRRDALREEWSSMIGAAPARPPRK